MTKQHEVFQEMKEYLDQFIDDRKWDKYRTPKNLSMALSVEVAELVELFQWLSEKESWEVTNIPDTKEQIEEEMADVLSYLVQLAGKLEIDLHQAFWKKTKKNEAKHSIEKALN
ncbi:MAG: nucleotide pyrophosphohydrolase [Chlamydiales bacterium]|nr:nucleotide pyrophosphohydrolase [Chlamydiales bacterium]